MRNIEKFMESIEVNNTKKVVKHVLSGVNVDIDYFGVEDLHRLILDMHPASPKQITTICYVLGLYAKWLQEQGLDNGALLSAIQAIDKTALWKKAKPQAKKKFISNKAFCGAINDIEIFEEYNPLYYSTLCRCIYEGVYNEDMSVLVNLRGSDISGNMLTLREDNGHTYKLKVSAELAENLRQLSTINTWLRPNRNGICRVEMVGTCSDSIFKVEYRNSKKEDSGNTYRFSYYARLRKISDEYFGYRILPLHLFISGVMHRIQLELEQNGISIGDAFAENSRNKLAHEIISKELIRCNYTSDIWNFREMVKGHLDAFV